jgi:hypothetical protein
MAGFLASTLESDDDSDRFSSGSKTKCVFGADQESLDVTSTAKRVRAHSPDAVRRHVAHALAETTQTFERPLLCRRRQPSGLVESGGQLHHLAQSVEHSQFTPARSGDDHVKAVRAEIDRGDAVRKRWSEFRHDALPAGCERLVVGREKTGIDESSDPSYSPETGPGHRCSGGLVENLVFLTQFLAVPPIIRPSPTTEAHVHEGWNG